MVDARNKRGTLSLGIATVTKIAVTGKDQREESVPPIENYTDKLLISGGGALAALAVLPGIAMAGPEIAAGARLGEALDVVIPQELAEAYAGAATRAAKPCAITGAAARLWDVANHQDALGLLNGLNGPVGLRGAR